MTIRCSARTEFLKLIFVVLQSWKYIAIICFIFVYIFCINSSVDIFDATSLEATIFYKLMLASSLFLHRLIAYERNKDWMPEAVILTPTPLPDWPEAGFRQLSMDHRPVIPPISSVHIENYFIHRQVNINFTLTCKSYALVLNTKLYSPLFATTAVFPKLYHSPGGKKKLLS